MNSDLTSQMYMLIGLTQIGMNNDSTQNKFSYIKTYLPILIMFSPFLIKILNMIYDWIEELIYNESGDKIVSIKFPVHEILVHKNCFKSESSSMRHLYSINYLAINDYIRNNLHKINGISNLIEILNSDIDYYSEDTNEKNFVLIPSDSNEILIEHEKKIYCKIISTEKKSDNNERDNDKKKSQNTSDKVKIYELILFCKLEQNIKEISDEIKKKINILNNFIESCVIKYNLKKDDKYQGKHWIYEYSHSYKDEYSGLELKFKEYLFENNKDLETNIFFEGKEKLIKYIDKFIYNKEEVENKIPNKYELEYKSIGYTYKATFLLYGFPGCGKTSTIKAILNRTKRHGIIINWSKIKTCEELETIFRNRTINHKEYDARELCYIIEDCDASENNILLSRKKQVDQENLEINNIQDNIQDSIDNYNNNDNNDNDNSQNNYSIDEKIKQELNIKKTNDIQKLGSIEKILKKISKSSSYGIDLTKLNDDSLNLSCLLNILDGIIELHGVMVIFTTNHPEKLDEAFLRPGRIDFKQEFKRANFDTIKSIINSKFKSYDNFEFLSEKINDYVLSPAEIQSICFKNDNIDDCIIELLEEHNKNIYRLNNEKI
jgi:hypothetical protein